MSYSDIDERYRLIKPFLGCFQRRFTVLDLGAFEGAMSFQIARDFPESVVIAVEQDPIIIEKAREANLPNVLVLNRKISAVDLAELATCEHFDVVLSLNFLHHLESGVGCAYNAINSMSCHQFYQTPYPGDSGACGQERLDAIYFSMIGMSHVLGATRQFDGHMERPLLHRCSPFYSVMTRSSLHSPPNCNKNLVACGTSFKRIQLEHKGEASKDWVFGFNLANFCTLGGGWPKKQRVIELLRKMPLPERRHGDIAIHNIIFDGQRMQLIDGGDDWGVDDRENLERVIRKVEERLP
jgi:hypothetical protein